MSTPIRLVLRRGIELNRDGSGWVQTIGGQAASDELRARFGPEPIVVETLFGDGIARADLYLQNRRSFGLEQSWLHQRFTANEHGGCRLEWNSVDYLLGAVGYHCLKMAESYATVRRRLARHAVAHNAIAPLRTGRSLHSGVSDSIWYELDGLLSAARRALDMSRYLLWNTYGKGRDCPRNFLKTVNSAALPDALRSRLLSTWERFGQRLTDYRDCIQHYTHLDRFDGAVFIERDEHGNSFLLAQLPDNPEAQSLARFTYNEGIDALDYAYTIATEWIDVMKAVARQVKPFPDFDRD